MVTYAAGFEKPFHQGRFSSSSPPSRDISHSHRLIASIPIPPARITAGEYLTSFDSASPIVARVSPPSLFRRSHSNEVRMRGYVHPRPLFPDGHCSGRVKGAMCHAEEDSQTCPEIDKLSPVVPQSLRHRTLEDMSMDSSDVQSACSFLSNSRTSVDGLWFRTFIYVLGCSLITCTFVYPSARRCHRWQR